MSASGVEEEAVVQERLGVVDGIELPPVIRGGSRDKLVLATKSDPSLKGTREAATREVQGFYWKQGHYPESCEESPRRGG